MNIKNLNKFRELLINSKKSVSELEYTKNNYDHFGNLIEEDLPTITTDFCEIGLYNNEIYFVFVVESKTFNIKLFDKLKNKSNVNIYGFIDFNKTLFPTKDFNFDNFVKEIKNDKYLQIQFDFKNIDTFDLFKKYSNIVNVFGKNKVVVVNQLKVDLTKHK
ncbi:MAG: hypothetical protein ABIE03_05740 [Patescibacteria group bacterium]|nr:hypothetical protein [Patescibacteria group bacterium]